jgi:hypothetical protein
VQWLRWCLHRNRDGYKRQPLPLGSCNLHRAGFCGLRKSNISFSQRGRSRHVDDYGNRSTRVQRGCQPNIDNISDLRPDLHANPDERQWLWDLYPFMHRECRNLHRNRNRNQRFPFALCECHLCSERLHGHCEPHHSRFRGGIKRHFHHNGLACEWIHGRGESICDGLSCYRTGVYAISDESDSGRLG